MALAGAGRTQEEDILVLGDEVAGGELVEEPPIHLLVEFEVEVVEGALPVPQVGRVSFAVE